jgi:hypothetical protein
MKRRYGLLLLLLSLMVFLGGCGQESAKSEYVRAFDLAAGQRGEASLHNRKSYAWGESYNMMAFATMYEATGDIKYLNTLSRHIDIVLKNRDDNLGIKDYKGRSMPGWGTQGYSKNPDAYYVWAVHTGMITYPMAQFVRFVYEDESLHKKFKAKADTYLAEVERSVKAHDEDFIPGPGSDEGYYTFGDATAEVGIALETLPFNQQNALGRTIIELYRITGKEEYLDKATRLANFMKHRLYIFPNGSYVWMYHLPPSTLEGPIELSEVEASQVASRCEDTSHAAINADFMVQAYKAGIVFDDEDVERLTLTLLENVFTEDNSVRQRIGGVGSVNVAGYSNQVGRWLELGLFDKRVFQMCSKYYMRETSIPLISLARLAKADLYWTTF